MSQKEAFEPTGLIPRSIIRTVDRFLQQLLPGKERIAIQEYRISRYQILVSIKSLLTITCIPLLINYTLKALLLTPLTEHFWNSYQGDLFLNQYQEKRAFAEMQDFSEKMFFELLSEPNSETSFSSLNASRAITRGSAHLPVSRLASKACTSYNPSKASLLLLVGAEQLSQGVTSEACMARALVPIANREEETNHFQRHNISFTNLAVKPTPARGAGDESRAAFGRKTGTNLRNEVLDCSFVLGCSLPTNKACNPNAFAPLNPRGVLLTSEACTSLQETEFLTPKGFASFPHKSETLEGLQEISFLERSKHLQNEFLYEEPQKSSYLFSIRSKTQKPMPAEPEFVASIPFLQNEVLHHKQSLQLGCLLRKQVGTSASPVSKPTQNLALENTQNLRIAVITNEACSASVALLDPSTDIKERGEEESFYSTFLLRDSSKAAFQAKSIQVAQSYNKQSILAITNLLGDLVTFLTVCSLFRIMRPEIIILKSFLTESVYSLSDTTKSFLLILGMDLLVGFHSPRGWEIVLEGLLRHVGLPENENFVLLFVALFPVFLDTVFKYWIFRYLNKISPSTVVTYHSMIE